MRQLRAAVEINAPPARVWAVCTDFRSFPSWNPFISSAEGPLVQGGRIDVTLRLWGWPVRLHPELTVVDEPAELRWLARAVGRGVFDVDRRFLLEPVGSTGCRFVQSESGSGLLAPLLMPLLRREILRGYQRFGLALKLRVEQVG